MNRRILLIDADPGFFQTLSDTLSRYAFDVVNEADPDQAILLAGAEAPALLVVGVDEPDKLGFKVFQRCKKGALAKVPIMLVTSSVSTESFAKHKGLKTHADEYVDKRKVSRDDLLAKIDGLIKLGDPIVEDSLDIPLEIDDIQMGDEGDMVLEEEVGDDAGGGDFGDDPHSPLSISDAANLVNDPHPEPAASSPRRVDSMVDADIEDAFGGLLGDDYVEPMAEPAELIADPIPEEVPAPEPISVSEMVPDLDVPMEAVPEVVGGGGMIALPDLVEAEPSVIGAPVHDDVAEDVIEEAVPGAIHDGGLSAADDVNEFENFNEQSTRGPRDLDDLEDSPVQQKPIATRAPSGFESSPAIALDEEDLQALEEESAVPEVVPHVNVRDRDPEPESAPEPVTQIEQLPIREPDVPAPPIVATPEPTRPKFIESSTATNIGAAPAPVPAAPLRPSGVLNVVDLGLDRIAEDADRDQSGLHDRRELRKINELERQISQLKAEVERTRATAESTTRPAGREGEFLKLRENLLNGQKELQKAKDELAARDRELAELADKLRQVQAAKTAFETQAIELEQKHAAESHRAGTVEARERALATQLATVQQDLAAKTLAADNAESVRAQLERDVANERALRASSSSDAERTLRIEREQMIARHQGELASLRADAAAAQEVALAAFRAELEAAHAAEAAAASTAHAAALSAAADAGRREIAIEAEAAVTQLEQRQAADIKRLEDESIAALAAKSTELQQLQDEILRLGDESAGKLARLASERDSAIEKAKAEAAQAAERAQIAAAQTAEQARLDAERGVEAARAEAAQTIADAKATAAAEQEQLRAEAAQARREAEQHAAQLQADHAAALAKVREDHAAELGRMQADASGQVVAASAANDRALAEARAEIASIKAAMEEAAAAHAEATQRALASQASALAEQATMHNAVLAKRDKEASAALDELRAELERQAAAHEVKLDAAKRDLDLMLEQHEVAKQQIVEQQKRDAEALAAQHRDELAKVAEDKQHSIEEIQKASAEHRAAVEKAAAQHRDELALQKDAADRELAEFRSALQAAKKSIEDATAKHTAEREAADQAHASALAELTAQHERALAVVNGEVVRTKAVGDADHGRAMAAKETEHKAALAALEAAHQRANAELTAERDELRKGLSGTRDASKRTESELAAAVQTIADRNSELRSHAAAVAERDQRIAELRKEIETVEQENTSYQEQVLRAYQKIKTDEAMVARAKKAMAIALTVLDDQGQPKES